MTDTFKTDVVREVARRELNMLIDKVVVGGDKRKGILLDPALVDPFKLTGVSKAAFSRERGVEFIAAIDDTAEPIKTKVRSLVVLVRPTLKMMQPMAKCIRAYHEEDPSMRIFIYFVPRKTLICQHLLMTEYGITDEAFDDGTSASGAAQSRSVIHAEIDELEIDYFPLEEDVLSMESPNIFRELFLDGDPTCLEYIARSLLQLQRTFVGPIPRTTAKGAFACKLLKFLRRMTNEVGFDHVTEASQVEAMYIVDRGVDLMTPLATQLTHEGLLDELYGIKTAGMKLPIELTETQAKPSAEGVVDKRGANGFPTTEGNAPEGHILLNSTDNVFTDLRDRNTTQVGGVLHDKAVEVKGLFERRKTATNLKEIKEIVRNIPMWQETQRLISIHASICQTMGKITQSPQFRKRIQMEQSILLNQDDKTVLDYIEELIDRGESFKKVLRLMCMFSLANNGIKAKVYEQLRESLMLSYGIPQVMATLYVLERTGLLTKGTGLLQGAAASLHLRLPSGTMLNNSSEADRPRPPFSHLRKACRLWVDNLNERNPTDVAYAYSGYAPLLLRTVEALAQHDAAMAQASASGTAQAAANQRSALNQIPGEMDTIRNDVEVAGHTRTVLIFVLGGVTHAEISAIRYILGALDDAVDREEGFNVKRNYLVVSTSIISGSKMIQSLLPFESN